MKDERIAAIISAAKQALRDGTHAPECAAWKPRPYDGAMYYGPSPKDLDETCCNCWKIMLRSALRLKEKTP